MILTALRKTEQALARCAAALEKMPRSPGRRRPPKNALA
jgi:hypothetical protein